METKRTESRLGRFAALLKGRARPRRSLALMMALVIVAVMSFAGVVSADNYYNGTVPENVLHGCVNGSVDVKFADTWNTTPVTDWSQQETWANFTLNLPPGATLKFAELVVVPYCGSMSADYYGNMTVKLYNGNVETTTLVSEQPLNLSYFRVQGTNYSSLLYGGYLVNLSRVTSDYVADFNVTSNLTGWTGSTVNVKLTSRNLTGRFDGRFKEAKLAYGWDVLPENSTAYTCYWKNLGHDPVTKYLVNPYTTNQTVFSIGTVPLAYNANLWVNFVAGNSTSGPGYGKYWWNGRNFTVGSGWNSGYPPADWFGSKYAGYNHWTWNESITPEVPTGEDNILAYSRTNDYYKIIFALFTISPCNSCP